MKSGLITISDLFDGSKKFIIPQYQRAYAWEQKQLNDFYYDIYYHNSNKKYFYGTVLLKEESKKRDFEMLEIVDGQQRITTLIVFFYLLFNKIEKMDGKKHDEYSLEIKRDKYIEYRNEYKINLSIDDDDFFKKYILNKKKAIKVDTPSQKRLYAAKEFFQKCIENLSISKIIEMIDVIENADILVYSVKNSAEAALIFETTNDRGKDLTNLEKIKSFLMYKAFISSDKKGANEVINKIFKRFGDIYKIIENLNGIYNKMGIKTVTEDQVCQYDFICNFEWEKKSDYQNYLDYIKNKLNKLSEKNQFVKILNFVENYTLGLLESFQALEGILLKNYKGINEIVYLDRIALYFPLLIKSYINDNEKDKSNFKRFLGVCKFFCVNGFLLIQVISKSVFKDNRKM